jgi:anaerobic selenocysteine-containing dehydrogenase
LDPRRTETAKVADQHFFVRPGTDALILLALANVLLDEDLARPASYIDGLASVKSAIIGFTPDLAEHASGMPPGSVRALARDLAAAGAAAVHVRMGASTQEFGVLSQWAAQVVNILTGSLDRPGGTMFTSPAIDMIGKGLLSAGHLGAWTSRVRGLPEFGGELPVAALTEEITTPGGPDSGAPDHGRQPGLVYPGWSPTSPTRSASSTFMASLDFYINETTRHADVILPPTGPLERDHYDLVFHMFAVRNTARWSSALFERPADARHDWEIARDLALRILTLRASEPGAAFTRVVRRQGSAPGGVGTRPLPHEP